MEQFSSADNTLKISWDYFQGAESYDLEWVFVADGDSSGNHSTNSDILYDFRNATRINLLNTEYALPMAFPKGSIIYRVRGAGYNIHKPEDYPERMVVSNWSYQPTVFNLNQASSDNIGYYYTTGLNTDKNWTYTAVYAEEGKRKEVASYFDGSGRSRQQVTVQNTDNYAIIGETYYDYLGRGVVNVLPTPVENQGVQFYGTAQNPFNGTFGPEQFATDDHLDENPSVIPEPLDSTANTSKYYSSSNSLEFVNKSAVPVGDGYNYTFTQYTNDGTERPRQQTGLGDEMKWQAQDSHNTKFFYTKPLQNDIDRLFGNEVGDAVFYQKVISIDPNGQQSVQYLDAKGRVIATALAGEAPSQLDELDNKEEVVLKSKLFDSPKNVQGPDLIEAYNYFPSSPDDAKLIYNLNTGYMESCYQTTGKSYSEIKYDIKLKVSTTSGVVIDSVVLDNRGSVVAEDLNLLDPSLKEYVFSRHIKVNEDHKAAYLAREDSLLEVNKLTSTCGPRYYISADTICDSINCDSLCLESYTFQYNDSFNHSSWLTFMKNRLEVARDLLTSDGVIFVSCDDNEVAYLKILMDELFKTENFIAWYNVASTIKSGRILVTSECNGTTSKELATIVYPSNGTNFKITASSAHKFADGNQILTLKTDIIQDEFGNEVTNGTLVTFVIKNDKNSYLYTIGTTLNGMAEAKTLHPDKESNWEIQGFITGAAESNKIQFNFKSAIKDFPVYFSKGNRNIDIGPFESFMKQLVPDGILLQLDIYDIDGDFIETKKTTTKNGSCTIYLGEHFLPDGNYKLKIKAAGITKEFIKNMDGY